MTQFQSIELAACFGILMGFLGAIIICDIKFAIDHFREKRKEKDGDADVE